MSSEKPAALNVPGLETSWSVLYVDSFAELLDVEQAILERIKALPNGGLLFLTHPLMLLEDVGVAISEDARVELLEREPALGSLSALSYMALRDSQLPQTIHCHLNGLFARNDA